jgi:hypothetical protein
MTVAELRGILSHLQNLYVAGGAKGPAKDLQIIADLLRPHADARLGNFIEDLRARLSQGKAKAKPRQKSDAKPTLNENTIVAHVTRLRDAGTQQSRFEEALERLKADTALKLADVTEIARRYSNSVTKYRSLAAAQKDISQAFVRRARFENKLQ